MQMVSMNVDDDDAVRPQGYDCCPRIYLNAEQVEALGIQGMPEPGTVFLVQAHAVVTSMTATAEQDNEEKAEGKGTDVSLSLKLVEMAAQPAGGDKASVLYGS